MTDLSKQSTPTPLVYFDSHSSASVGAATHPAIAQFATNERDSEAATIDKPLSDQNAQDRSKKGLEQIIPEADSLKRRCEEAERKGYQAGSSEATERYASQSQLQKESVAAALEQIEAIKRTQLRQLEPKLLSLSLQVAEEILHREVLADHLFLSVSVRYALEQMHGESQITLKVAPTDHVDWLNLFTAAPFKGSSVTIAVDPSLQTGMCRIESLSGALELSAERQLAELSRGFHDLLDQKSPFAGQSGQPQ